jgi:hypothetical protein
VHGGLLVYEDRFNAELLAAVLAIPSSKTLLRRHLSLQFASLVGKSVLQAKREAEINRQTNSVPLSPSAKIKVNIFTLIYNLSTVFSYFLKLGSSFFTK